MSVTIRTEEAADGSGVEYRTEQGTAKSLTGLETLIWNRRGRGSDKAKRRDESKRQSYSIEKPQKINKIHQMMKTEWKFI